MSISRSGSVVAKIDRERILRLHKQCLTVTVIMERTGYSRSVVCGTIRDAKKRVSQETENADS